MDRPTIDFMDAEFGAVFAEAVGGLKRGLRTAADVFLYTASGHGSWEATLVNLFSPGDLVLIVETGWFSEGWAAMAEKFGLRTQVVAAPDWRRGIEYAAITAALKGSPEAKAVLCVHNETATGMMLDLPSVRAPVRMRCCWWTRFPRSGRWSSGSTPGGSMPRWAAARRG